MTVQGDTEKALAYSRRLISIRPRSEKELRDRLFQKRFKREIILKVISCLKKENEINDLYFAKLWIESRIINNPRSSRLLKKELMQKGVSSSIIDTILSEITEKDDVIARRFAKKRAEKMKALSAVNAKRKLFSLLARRGFDIETIDDILREIFAGRD